MKKVLALLLMMSIAQGSLLLGEDLLYKHYIQELNVIGGFDNLQAHFEDAEITKECVEISRPWNMLYNALTINDSKDFSACYQLNKEFEHFQQKFLAEVRDKNVINNHIFYAQYFANNYSQHESMISNVFYRETRKLDRKVTQEVLAYQNALRRSVEKNR
jgi:hypothetical protein